LFVWVCLFEFVCLSLFGWVCLFEFAWHARGTTLRHPRWTPLEIIWWGGVGWGGGHSL
jgi:hypothetical protein